MAETRLKDLTKTLTYAQWLASFSPADSAANGTGKILGQTIVDKLLTDKISSTGLVAKTIVNAGTADEKINLDVTPVIDATMSGSGTAGSPFGISNPSFYVKGNSIYGGTFTDNLNTLARTTPFTCYGTATGAPNTSYSWFGWHINSNTGTTAAAQIAYAYNSASIICYERVKTSSTWGAWTLRPVRGVWPVQTFSAGTLTATAGILYKGTEIANLTLALAAQEGGEYHIKFSTASTIGTFDLSAVTSWIGTAPTIAAGKTYEIDILDGVGICAEVS